MTTMLQIEYTNAHAHAQAHVCIHTYTNPCCHLENIKSICTQYTHAWIKAHRKTEIENNGKQEKTSVNEKKKSPQNG